MINLPDDAYDVVNDDYSATVYIKRNRSPRDMPGLPAGVRFPDDAYIYGDRLGRFNYTKVRIIFHHDVYIKPSINFQDVLFFRSVDLINRILSVCGGLKGDHYVRIIDSDILSHNLMYYNPQGEVVPLGASAIGGQMVIGTGGANEPFQEQVLKIKNVLSNNAQLPLWQSLLFDAWDNHFYRNYRSAVIDSGTAFEVFIYGYIRNGYLRLGKTDEEIENILEAGFKNLLRNHIRILTDTDFANTNEYNVWENSVYEKRNEVVHRGGTASDVDSAETVTKVAETIRYINSLSYLK